MKITAFTSLVIVLSGGLFTYPSFSEEKGQGERPDLRKLDKDGDRSISREEAGPEIWSRLGTLDKNGDGKVSGDEFPRPGGGNGTPGAGKGNPGEFFKQLDKNGDGALSKEEVPAQAWERIGKLDKNGDNTVSKDEFAAGAKERMGMSGGFFENLDKNKDGQLTESEVPQGWDRISKADRDKDGAISKEEMAAARAFMEKNDGPMGKFEGRGKGPDGGPGAIFEKYDVDKDGKLTKEEVPAELWAKLSRADDDADGRVSKEELANVYQKMPGMNPAKKEDGPKRPSFEKTEG